MSYPKITAIIVREMHRLLKEKLGEEKAQAIKYIHETPEGIILQTKEKKKYKFSFEEIN